MPLWVWFPASLPAFTVVLIFMGDLRMVGRLGWVRPVGRNRETCHLVNAVSDHRATRRYRSPSRAMSARASCARGLSSPKPFVTGTIAR